MKLPQKSVFQLYRYQILPLSREFQPTFFDPEIKTLDSLLERKNEFFMNALLGMKELISRRSKLVYQRFGPQKEAVILQIAANRSVNLETPEFTSEEVENWPSIVVAIDNDPTVQLIAVQRRTAAFQYTTAPVNSIIEAVNLQLKSHQLRAIAEPLFEKHVFWDLMRRYEGKVQQVSFELITPNMSNISHCLSEDLKTLAKATNTTRTKLELNSEPDSVLEIKKDYPGLEGLVEYTSSGGGDIKIKATGMRRSVHTSKTIQEVSIDQVEAEGNDPKALVEAIKGLLR